MARVTYEGERPNNAGDHRTARREARAAAAAAAAAVAAPRSSRDRSPTVVPSSVKRRDLTPTRRRRDSK